MQSRELMMKRGTGTLVTSNHHHDSSSRRGANDEQNPALDPNHPTVLPRRMRPLDLPAGTSQIQTFYSGSLVGCDMSYSPYAPRQQDPHHHTSSGKKNSNNQTSSSALVTHASTAAASSRQAQLYPELVSIQNQLASKTPGYLASLGLTNVDVEKYGDELCAAAYLGNTFIFNSLANNLQLLHEARGPHNRTPLMLAARRGDTTMVSDLIERRVPPNAQDSDGCTALHHAVEAGDEKCTRLLLRYGADPNIGARDLDLATPLALALGFGNYDLMVLLMENKAKMDIESPPIQSAVRFLVEFEQSFAINQQVWDHRERGIHHSSILGKGKNPVPLEDDYSGQDWGPSCRSSRLVFNMGTVKDEVVTEKPFHENFTDEDLKNAMADKKARDPRILRSTKEATLPSHPGSPERSRCERFFPTILKKWPKLAKTIICPNDVTVLHLCARKLYGNCVRALIKVCGVKDDVRDKTRGYLAIHEACASGLTAVGLEALVDWHRFSSPWKNLEQKESRFGMTPFLVAAEYGRLGTLGDLKDIRDVKKNAVSDAGYGVHHLLCASLGLTITDAEMRVIFIETQSMTQPEEKVEYCLFGNKTKDVGFTPFHLGVLKDIIRDRVAQLPVEFEEQRVEMMLKKQNFEAKVLQRSGDAMHQLLGANFLHQYRQNIVSMVGEERLQRLEGKFKKEKGGAGGDDYQFSMYPENEDSSSSNNNKVKQIEGPPSSKKHYDPDDYYPPELEKHDNKTDDDYIDWDDESIYLG